MGLRSPEVHCISTDASSSVTEAASAALATATATIPGPAPRLIPRTRAPPSPSLSCARAVTPFRRASLPPDTSTGSSTLRSPGSLCPAARSPCGTGHPASRWRVTVPTSSLLPRSCRSGTTPRVPPRNAELATAFRRQTTRPPRRAIDPIVTAARCTSMRRACRASRRAGGSVTSTASWSREVRGSRG
jgi:hypothetical protein